MKPTVNRTVTGTVTAALLGLTAILTTSTASASTDGQQIRRFALVIGANHGGAERVTLRYANSDARNFARVLQELGGVAASDVVLLIDPDRAALDQGFARMRAHIAANGQRAARSELIIYYSGHSDENGLLMHGQRYTYADLRLRIRSMPSDVNIAVLDSCASGALTRRKGGVKRPPFLVDHAVKVKGYAFLTSSSADEAAQESDRIAASYFTHFLVSGMRGGADANHDARVTLNEAYQFAFNETVARTRGTQAGPQHPAYDIHLVGTGDVVLTDLRTTDAALQFASELRGRLFIHNQRGQLVSELEKAAGQPTVLALGAGTYDLTLVQGKRRFRARVAARRGARAPVAHVDFLEMVPEPTTSRGTISAGSAAGSTAGPAVAPSVAPASPAQGASLLAVGAVAAGAPESAPVVAQPGPSVHRQTVHVPISLQIIPTGNLRFGTINHLQLALLVGQGYQLFGMEASGLVNIRSGHVGGVQVAGLANVNEQSMGGIQAAGIVNVNGRTAIGAQVAGIANVTDGSVFGVQAAGLTNIADGSMAGIQAAGLANVVDGNALAIQAAGLANVVDGNAMIIQAAGIANVVDGRMAGIQAAGIANVADSDAIGIQTAGIANVVDRHFTGLQLSGIANVTDRRMTGLQVALVNVGGVVRGGQIGLINVAERVHGFQLGLVNVSQDAVAPIGLFSYAGRGRFDVEAWTSDTAPLSLGVKLGSRRVYGVLSVAANDDRYLFGWGLGVHMDYRNFYIDVDALGYTITDRDLGDADNDALGSLRVMAGIPVGAGLSIFGGLALTGTMAFDGKDGGDMTFMKGATISGENTVVRITPGFLAGVSY